MKTVVSFVAILLSSAFALSGGQMTVPAYVLQNLPANGSTPVSLQLSLLNRLVTIFTASGLDLASIRYGVTYTVDLRLQ